MLYPYFDNGTWESYLTGPEYYSAGVSGGGTKLEKNGAQFHDGAFSGKLSFPGPNGISTQGNLSILRGDTSFGGSPIRIVGGLTPGLRYRFSCWVYVDPTFPIASDNARISVGPINNSQPINSTSGPMIGVLATTVLAAKGTWVQIYYDFVQQPTGTGYDFIMLKLWTETTTGNGYGNVIPRNGSLNITGIMYVDDILIVQLDGPCDLSFGTPAYTKTDETAEDADDGTITVFADNTTPGSPYTPRYAIDGGTYQLSNIFTGVIPGVHTITVNDDRGTCVISIDVFIAEANPPPPPPPPAPEGTLIINQKPLNSFNHIAWFQTSGKINFANIACTNLNWDLPKGYRKRMMADRPHKHRPVVINDEQFSFYINFDTNFNYPNFSSLRLDLINDNGLVQTGIAELQRVFQDDGVNYFIYASVTLVDIPTGNYRLSVADTSTTNPFDILFVSNEIMVMADVDDFILDEDGAEVYTARFQWRCSVSIYRYLYEKIPDYFNELRLMVNVVDEQLSGKIEQYRAITSGKLRNTAYDLDLFYEFETYYFDDIGHRAMYVHQVNDQILVNGKAMLVKEIYKVQWRPERNVNKGTLQMFEQDFSTANKYGRPNEFVITDPVILGDDGQPLLI
jgi:hypothetical protein